MLLLQAPSAGVHFEFAITVGQIAVTGALIGVAKVLLIWHKSYLIFMAEHSVLRDDYLSRHRLEPVDWEARVAVALAKQKANGKVKGAHA